MTELRQVYKCSVCGNIVELIHPGPGELVCCSQPMKLLPERVTNEGTEKHLPVIKETSNGYIITIGSVKHPMTTDHYIEWIELIADNLVYRIHLKPGMEPRAVFNLNASSVSARSFCNIHGLWKKTT